MSGKLDTTDTTHATHHPRAVRAYCEGRRAKIDGDSNNPHPSGSEANVEWQRGYDEYNGAGTAQPQDCCADILKV